MVMELVQVRLPEGLTMKLDTLVKRGYYSSKSDVIRDAIRRLILEKQIGSIPNMGDSVQEIRALRQQLSKEDLDLDKINQL